MEPFVLGERDGPVVIASFNRPDQMNAITEAQQCDEILAFCTAMTRYKTVRAIVLTGAGKAFCAGGNVKHMQERAGMFAGSPYDIRHTYRTTVQLVGPALYNLEVPIIAAINGAAIGLGLDLSCMCDIRLASEKAVVAESYVKLGIIPGGGGAWILPRIVGNARAALMTLTGDAIKADKMLEYGLVAEVLPPEDLLPRAKELAHAIAANPGHATRMAKRLLREGQAMTLPALLEMAAAFQAAAHHTEDHLEAVNAMLEKRSPQFTGK
ncbi:MAG: crotonase/enoyl-CoA hydratase family protein [Sphingomonadales bacterium]|nr:crotonase/enoyl-CoA hydratase family protein [Sphingomonadales bacterium]